MRGRFRKYWATSKTWTRTPENLDLEKPVLGKTCILKNLDPEKSRSRKTCALKNQDPEKPGPWKTSETAGYRKKD